MGSFLTRLLAAADEFAHYRVRRLSFRLLPDATITTTYTAGYVGGVQDTLPSTTGSILELDASVRFGGLLGSVPTQTVPSEWIKVDPKELSGALPWYKSVRGSADVTEEAPGVLVFGGAGSAAIFMEVRALYEFKAPVAPANTPLTLELRSKLRQEIAREAAGRKRDELLRLLSSNSVGSVRTQAPAFQPPASL